MQDNALQQENAIPRWK